MSSHLRATAFICPDAFHTFIVFLSFSSHFQSFPPVWVWRMFLAVCVRTLPVRWYTYAFASFLSAWAYELYSFYTVKFSFCRLDLLYVIFFNFVFVLFLPRVLCRLWEILFFNLNNLFTLIKCYAVPLPIVFFIHPFFSPFIFTLFFSLFKSGNKIWSEVCKNSQRLVNVFY